MIKSNVNINEDNSLNTIKYMIVTNNCIDNSETSGALSAPAVPLFHIDWLNSVLRAGAAVWCSCRGSRWAPCWRASRGGA
jgi:hypothetical protein